MRETITYCVILSNISIIGVIRSALRGGKGDRADMPVHCSDLLNLPTMRNLKLLGGRAGLDRVVTWPYVGGEDYIGDWARGGELLFVMNASHANRPETLRALLVQCADKKLAGLILVNPSADRSVGESFVRLADELEFAVFELTGTVKTAEIMREIGNYIVKEQNDRRHLYDVVFEILYGTHANKQQIEERARFFGYDLNCSHQVCVIRFVNFDSYVHGAGYRDGDAQAEFRTYLNQVAQSFAAQHVERAMSIPKSSNEIVLLMPVKTSDDERLRMKRIEEWCKNVMRFFSDLNIKAGVGRVCDQVWDCKKSLKEAEQALLTAVNTDSPRLVTRFEELDMFRIFYKFPDQAELSSYVKAQLGPLLRYDRDNGGELIKTLETYFDCRLNVNQTAKELFVHRNSLMYRFKKIEELLGRNLDETESIRSLFFSTLVLRFLNVQGDQNEQKKD